MERGLRQGDPMSPFLFVIVAEVLNKMIQRAEGLGLIRGLQIGTEDIQLTHLQFADDTLVFCEAKEENVRAIKQLFVTFQAISGLCVNYTKSGILVLGREKGWSQKVAKFLGCNCIQLPITYLGIPLGANMRKASSWKMVLDKVQNRLQTWKSSSLSRAGRLVMVKAVLNCLPLYYMSLFKIPKKVANDIVRLQRKFLWSGEKEGRCMPLVKWDIVTQQKNEGGLGVSDLAVKNVALLCKWWWRFAQEEEALWRKVVQSIHKEGKGLLPSQTVTKIPGPWQTLKKMLNDNSPLTVQFLQHLKVEVGNGERTRFWEDRWLQNNPIMSLFPELHMLSSQKHATIASMGWFEGEVWNWVFAWERELSQAEIALTDELQSLVAAHGPVQHKKDTLSWMDKRSYTVKEFQQIHSRGRCYDNLICKVWMNLAPPKVEFFMWLAMLDKLNTKELLCKKGMLTIEQKNCTFCSAEIETLNHVLMACSISWNIWCTIAKDLNQMLVMPETFKQHFAEWMGRKWRTRTMRRLWCSTFFSVAWSLWLMRNEIIFQGKELNEHLLCHLIRWRVAFWTKAWMKKPLYSAAELARKFDTIPELLS